jgi:4-alpha-glucanotransferase
LTLNLAVLYPGWLEDAALFAAIDQAENKEFWWEWSPPLRDREPKELKEARKEHTQFVSF